MELNPDKFSIEDKETKSSFYSWSVKLVAGAIGLFGISGILYGTGFLVMRSHYSFLGVWGGIPLSDTGMIVEEGGRFFYHLLYTLVNPLLSPDKYVFPLFIFLALAIGWRLISKFYHWVEKRYAKPSLEVSKYISLILLSLFLAIVLVGTILLLQKSWEVVGWHNVLYSCVPECQQSNYYCLCLGDISCPENTYIKVVWGTLVGIVISWVLYQQFWQRQGVIQQFLIAMQWLVMIAAVGIVPVAYGKLMMPLSYPSLTLSNTALGGEILLLAHTPTTWIIWNIQEKQTEIIPRNVQERIIIGQKKSLLPQP